MSAPDGPPLHPLCEPLAALLGTWRGQGSGDYPTIDDFDYVEEITFGHVGKPFVAYGQKTRDPATGAPMHAETGYLRPLGDGRLEMVIAQPTGIVELHEGTIDGGRIELVSTSVVTTATAKECEAVTRSLVVDGDELRYELHMAAVGQPLQHHLTATLRRAA